MCIFSSEAVVEKTIVMGAETLSGTHLMGYQYKKQDGTYGVRYHTNFN